MNTKYKEGYEMPLKSIRLCRAAKVGENVKCMNTSNIWTVTNVFDNGRVIVDEFFDMGTGDYRVTDLDPYSYWVIHKVKQARR